MEVDSFKVFQPRLLLCNTDSYSDSPGTVVSLPFCSSSDNNSACIWGVCVYSTTAERPSFFLSFSVVVVVIFTRTFRHDFLFPSRGSRVGTLVNSLSFVALLTLLLLLLLL